MSTDKICVVKNRSAGSVVYRIPDDNVRRFFQPGETKRIPAIELERLTYQTGGRELIADYLQITDETVVEDLNIQAQPEYWMSEEQVRDLLINGSLDAFLDALDFAPVGVIDLIKKYAVEIPLNDVSKREALKKSTGFDVSAALEHVREEQEPVTENVQAPVRRVQETASTPERRSTAEYKVIKKKD